jgi:hypothetical protein
MLLTSDNQKFIILFSSFENLKYNSWSQTCGPFHIPAMLQRSCMWFKFDFSTSHSTSASLWKTQIWNHKFSIGLWIFEHCLWERKAHIFQKTLSFLTSCILGILYAQWFSTDSVITNYSSFFKKDESLFLYHSLGWISALNSFSNICQCTFHGQHCSQNEIKCRL